VRQRQRSEADEDQLDEASIERQTAQLLPGQGSEDEGALHRRDERSEEESRRRGFRRVDRSQDVSCAVHAAEEDCEGDERRREHGEQGDRRELEAGLPISSGAVDGRDTKAHDPGPAEFL